MILQTVVIVRSSNIAGNVPRLGEELEFETRQPKPKLNYDQMLMLLLPAKF